MTRVALIVAVAVSVSLLATAYACFRSWRKERELQLRANDTLAARLRLLEERTTQAIVIVDRDGLIRRVNPVAAQCFGYSEAELFGQSILRLMPQVPSVRANASEVEVGLVEVGLKDGSRMRMCCKAAKSAEQEIYLFFDDALPNNSGAGREQPRQTPTLEVAERVVSRIVRQLEDLLTTINGYTELALHETSEDSPARKDLEEIASASDTASHLTRHLLAFTGNQMIPVEYVNLNAMLERLQPQFGAVQIEFCAEHLFVFANAPCLRQIIVIFCGSARHRVGHETAVQIVTSRRRLGAIEYAAITISDCGPALAPATLDCLFEPLFLDREELGVELSAIYGTVRNLGGLINVASEEGRGTTFEILIPLAHGEPGAAKSQLPRSVLAS
jgi:signal transduction histidine kinase